MGSLEKSQPGSSPFVTTVETGGGLHPRVARRKTRLQASAPAQLARNLAADERFPANLVAGERVPHLCDRIWE